MKILHTADLHLGQILYQYYDRIDEHEHFFSQLVQWCEEYAPDAMVISGDLFDISQPSATTKEHFNKTIANIHRQFPQMAIVATAGNHDSASRIEADSTVWDLSGVTLVGHGPSDRLLQQPDWQKRFIVEMSSGYIVAMPYMVNHRPDLWQNLLDYVDQRNDRNLPVVMMGHLAVTGGDFLGHSNIGTLRTQAIDTLGNGYDYLALGHIHRPQTIGYSVDDEWNEESVYKAGVARYSGSALHVSCDEAYPHSVSLVNIDRHEGNVHIKRLRIDELRHFYTIPDEKHEAAKTADEVLGWVDDFCTTYKKGYFRLRIDYSTLLPPDFIQSIYKRLEATNDEVRFNPKTIWEGVNPTVAQNDVTFDLAELQQMDDPFLIIERLLENYPQFNKEELENDFKTTIREELRRMDEEVSVKSKKVNGNETA